MSGTTRVPLLDAHAHAWALARALAHACERIEVAGSIRRRSPDVGDIEIVAIPRRRTEVIPGLLEDDTREVDELQGAIETLLDVGMLAPHPTDPKRGERYTKLLHRPSGLQVDIFWARQETWGLILAIRTGPADWSRRLVTIARARGYHVAGGELHRGMLGCPVGRTCELAPVPEERDVLSLLGLPWQDPEERA